MTLDQQGSSLQQVQQFEQRLKSLEQRINGPMIRAQRFQIMDSNEIVRAQLGVSDDQKTVSLGMANKAGKVIVDLRERVDGGAEISLYFNGPDSGGTTVMFKAAQFGYEGDFISTNGGRLTVFRNGPIAQLSTAPTGEPDLSLLNSAGVLTTHSGIVGGVGKSIDVQRDFGAIGDGSEADRAKVKIAIKTLQERGGGKLYLPAGIYTFDAPVTFSDVDIVVTGDGPGLTKLIWLGSDTNGILFSGQPKHHFSVNNVSILARGAQGTAVKATWLAPLPTDVVPSQNRLFYNITIGGETLTDCWTTGVSITNGREMQIANFHIYGTHGTDSVSYPMTRGIELLGSSTDVSIYSGHIVLFHDGIYAGPGVEGLAVHHLACVDGVTGISLDYPASGHAISGCHFNTQGFGIFASGTQNMAIHDNLFFALPSDPSHAWTGVFLRGASAWSITNNKFWRTGEQSSNGIVMEARSDCCVIQGNLFNGMSAAVWLLNESDGCIVEGNQLLNCSGPPNGIRDDTPNKNNSIVNNIAAVRTVAIRGEAKRYPETIPAEL